ncbi:hypothetical protein [Haematobacter genomosp. 1]|uniref:DUF4142 domain-containing protein n=1 Tax=Haematobacter genomosp. 1 TaxID=366618 RepID=A0A212AFI1_9RHOB|nr:hypothetical protein [Haematobacter genomosp. 1]OWJ80235.1 hypothetical protein CDV49_02855 [Haematobacter genomosp. 1]
MIRWIATVICLAGTPALAAGPVDPDWPCIQRRVPHLSLGQVWSGPVPDAAATERSQSAEIRDLARVISLRRTDLKEAGAAIDSFAPGRSATDLTALMVATFRDIDTTRDRVMSGITRYAHKQEDLDREINARRNEFDTVNAAEPKDFDRLDALETQIDWATRVFRDRQQSLTYVCETPVILEQRAFALGRLIAAHLPE